ncbi:MAG: wax ester/triacylglycerol synthase family O-acyltransferase [Nocardiaceae bacterium]|nr:wax ester/triacylglycerol synthase family O-acyltransferase [Nocardiaceae bacterium]
MTLRQLTSLDAQFLAIENSATQGHINVLAVVKATTRSGRAVGAEFVREVVATRLGLLPPLRWRLQTVPFHLDHPYWADGEVDLVHHVVDSAVPAPGSERNLAAHVARLIAQRLDRTRPLWRIHVIHGLDDGSVAVLISLHHAAVDGVSAGEILAVLFDVEPDRLLDAPAHVVAVQPREESLISNLGRASLRGLRALRTAPRMLPHLDGVIALRTLPGLREAAHAARRRRGLDTATTPPAPRTRFQRRLSGKRSVAVGQIPAKQVQAIRTAFGCTANDAIMAICAGGLRNWLESHDELPAEPLVALVPKSVRPSDQRHTYGNQAALMFVQVPTDTADARDRVCRAAAAMDEGKQHQRQSPPNLLEVVNDLIPPPLFRPTVSLSGAMSRMFGLRAPANLIISNVPGPSQTLYLGGARVRAYYPVSAITEGVGLNITVTSYTDTYAIGIVADHKQLPGCWELLALIEKEASDLEVIASRNPRNRSNPARLPMG